MKTTTRLRSPLKWHGGNSYLAVRIMAMFPSHETYVEPFGGAVSPAEQAPGPDRCCR